MIEKRYEKIDELTMKEINIETTEQILTLSDLLNRRVDLIVKIEGITADYKSNLAKAEAERVELDKLIEETIKLGIKEVNPL